MTHKDFIIELQKYYGSYEMIQIKKDLYDYVKKNYYESELDKLLLNIKMSFSTRWGKQPGMNEVIEAEEKYPIIIYLQGIRQIPDCEKKLEIEEREEIDEKLDLHGMLKELTDKKKLE